MRESERHKKGMKTEIGLCRQARIGLLFVVPSASMGTNMASSEKKRFSCRPVAKAGCPMSVPNGGVFA